jgi:hypothetical protein
MNSFKRLFSLAFVLLFASVCWGQEPARARRCYDERQQVTTLFGFLLSRCGNVGDPDSTYTYVETYTTSTGTQANNNVTWKDYDIVPTSKAYSTSVRIYYPPTGQIMNSPTVASVQKWLDIEKSRINLDQWTISDARVYNLNGNPSLPTAEVILYRVVEQGSAGGNGHYAVGTTIEVKQYRLTTDTVNNIAYDIIYKATNAPCGGNPFGTTCTFPDNLGRLSIATR